MSTQFRPLEIPPGVVAKATKSQRSSNWAEVNLMRWVEGQMAPVGGQSQYNFTFASRCKKVHGWFDLNQTYHVAYLCERHLYVDTNGTLTDISPVPPLTPPTPVGQGGYNDGFYSVGMQLLTGAFAAGATSIVMQQANPGWVQPTMDVYNVTKNLHVGKVLTFSGTALTLAAGAENAAVAGDQLIFDWYGGPRPVSSVAAQDRVPSAYSLDNFGAILYAMTSADGRLLKWDPAAGGGTVTGVSATAAFTTTSAIIYTTTIPTSVVAPMTVFDVTTGHGLGTVSSVATNSATATAQAAFYISPPQSSILASPHGIGVGPGMKVTDTTTGNLVGTILTYAPLSQTLTAAGGWINGYRGCFMPPNPGWGILGLTVRDTTTSVTLGQLQFYMPFSLSFVTDTSVPIHAGDTSIQMGGGGNPGYLIPGMTVTDADHFPGWSATVVSYIGHTLVVDTPVPSSQVYLDLTFSSGSRHLLAWSGSLTTASSGAADSMQFTSGTNEVITFTAPIASASSGSTDALSIAGSKLTLTANSLFAGAASDALSFIGNLAAVQAADSGRGPVPAGRCFVVTNERFIMVFGASDATNGGGPRRFAWCDQENPGAWDYLNITSQAGYLDVEPASPIICASAMRSGIIFFTAKKAYSSVFSGMPYIYNYSEIGSGATPWSPQSITNTSSMTVWMSKQGAYSYDGTSILPINCLVRPWVDDDIDLLQVREQACIVHVADFNEVWWFFPQDGYTKNSRCIIYSYKEGWWSMGRMARTAGITSSYTAHTIMADDLVAYQHEVPNAYPTNVPLPWAETYDLNLNSGSRLTTLKQLIPDVEGAVQNLLYSVFYRTSRSVALDASGNLIVAPELQTTPQQVRPNGYVDFRVTARDIRLRIEIGALPGQPRPGAVAVTVGQHLVDSVPRGDR